MLLRSEDSNLLLVLDINDAKVKSMSHKDQKYGYHNLILLFYAFTQAYFYLAMISRNYKVGIFSHCLKSL